MRFSQVQQTGISLLEVQLALAIFATSLSVIIHAYQQTGQSAMLLHQRQQAYLLMTRIVAILPSYQQHHLVHIATLGLTATSVTDCFSGSLCSPQASLTSWYKSWTQEAQQTLPSGSLVIDCPQQCQSGSRMVITIRWLSRHQSSENIAAINTDKDCQEATCIRLQWLL